MYREEQLKALLQGKRLLLAGYGREGKSTERLVRTILPDADITIVEGNENIVKEAAKGYDLIIKSPGIPTFVFEGHCDLNTITSQTDLFLQVYGSQTIGVTGTKGKSTTTNLIAAIMQHHNPNMLMAGNMGIPLFDVIPQIDEETTIVCEFSCHQLENIHRAPHTAILLNLFQEHLDHYHSYLDYQLAKLQSGLKQKEGDNFFYCNDNEELSTLVREKRKEMSGNVISYSIHSEQAELLRGKARKLQGDHNLTNIVVAYLAAKSLGVSDQLIFDTVAEFNGLEHRMELVGTYDGVTYYNDSISTIPEACIAAVSALQKVDSLIVGGFDRGIEYGVLGDFLAHSEVRNIVFVGEAGKRIKTEYENALRGSPSGKNILVESDYNILVPWLKERTDKGKICLLSPAAASYDAFKNFEERGRIYKELVKGSSEN
ncbi:MAG: UDP-N-acetylmuramoyl-L-alanine--D-glutamate ligase [Bacteroidales bacterium]|nr:UDP-N-acetylmuramoyl-L-alanine--D-glutamate ligase [Bacteroidales bacterium]